MKIEVRKPTQQELNSLGVSSWPIWTCGVSTFDWHYGETETCYLLEGKVTVEAEGKSVSFGKGDLVVFPQGLSCVWKVAEPVRKHYRFG
ncbi:MAG: cupin domain-containing protein [Verrucomicrobiia bacterium]|nr:cupin domain-containing protein [Verrucomicrobiota bacterium]